LSTAIIITNTVARAGANWYVVTWAETPPVFFLFGYKSMNGWIKELGARNELGSIFFQVLFHIHNALESSWV
jgi:hypothetical protein